MPVNEKPSSGKEEEAGADLHPRPIPVLMRHCLGPRLTPHHPAAAPHPPRILHTPMLEHDQDQSKKRESTFQKIPPDSPDARTCFVSGARSAARAQGKLDRPHPPPGPYVGKLCLTYLTHRPKPLTPWPALPAKRSSRLVAGPVLARVIHPKQTGAHSIAHTRAPLTQHSAHKHTHILHRNQVNPRHCGGSTTSGWQHHMQQRPGD